MPSGQVEGPELPCPSLGEDARDGVLGGQKTGKGHRAMKSDLSLLGPCISPPPSGMGAGAGLRSEVHLRQPRPCPQVRRRLLKAEQCGFFEGLGNRGWVFLQTQGLLCKTGFDSQAQRPQVPVGRQAEAGGFVCLLWRLRNKAWDKASPGFRQGSLSKQARAGMAVEAVACMSLASPSSHCVSCSFT